MSVALVVFFSAPVAILQAHDVIEVRRGDLEHHRVFQCLDGVDDAGLVSPRLARLDLALSERLGALPLDQPQPSREQIGRLILFAVVLQREGVTGVDDEQLPGITPGLRPPDLVPPGLLDSFSPWTIASTVLPRDAIPGRRFVAPNVAGDEI